MKSFIVVPILIIVVALGIAFLFEIPTADKLALDTDAEILAGFEENCLTPYSEISCQRGLECVLLSEKPYKNGICLAEGTELSEDLVNRYIDRENTDN